MRAITSFPPRTILVPLDVLGGSLAGLEAARILAARWRSRVELIHVDAGPPPAFAEGIDFWTADSLAAMARDVRHRLAEAAESVPRSASHVLAGAPRDIIPRLAADAAADLIVMAPRRRRTLPRLLSGSLSEESVHAASTPILTVREKPAAFWPRRILATVKWARLADRGLLMAREWADSLDAELGLLHVFEGGQEDEMERRAVVEHVLNVLGEPTPKIRWHWAAGRAFQEIPRCAEAEGYDMVVVGERARERWQDAVFGSTAERVLRASAVPVLSVPGRRAIRQKAGPLPGLQAVIV